MHAQCPPLCHPQSYPHSPPKYSHEPCISPQPQMSHERAASQMTLSVCVRACGRGGMAVSRLRGGMQRGPAPPTHS
ncbi:hypothetical protein BJV78DRAFT_701036 [Lactifluus subvellereus]|nr:hypothetical protein BJV78DRAFT_701036 [Lactifluus subvellereus]